MSEESQHEIKDPLALTPEEIAALPPDGGPDYNRLVFEASPYLLQHAANPVDWYPWGDEAFERARAEDRPVFLSIGYATCHWCHVMERESFEDPQVSGLLNRLYVPIKVDREERPDIDQVYMTVTQGLTGSGGWPMTVVLTPDRRPFFAGTYFPKHGRGGRAGMLDVLPHLAGLWKQQREQVEGSAEEITEWLRRTAGAASGSASRSAAGLAAGSATGLAAGSVAGATAGSEYEAGGLSPDLPAEACRELADRFDPHHGGFGQRPKFPTPHNLTFLLRYGRRQSEPHATEMALKTLEAMGAGGIHDHLGGGFHRYSTDPEWLVPHFEKMLYDQALLAEAYLEAFEVTGEEPWADLARDIFTYVTRDLALPEGGFASAEDADSEGVEGKFYLWTAEEVRAVLGAGEDDGSSSGDAERGSVAGGAAGGAAARTAPTIDPAVFLGIYGATDPGNYREEATGIQTGENILHHPRPLAKLAQAFGQDPAELVPRLAAARARLLAVRARRVRPLRDDKVLTDWNGLMIGALARGGRVLDEERWTEAAVRAAAFLHANLREPNGRLLRRWRAGRAGLEAVLDDHAYLAAGLIELYRTTFEPRWLAWAVELAEAMERRFWDHEAGGFHLTAADAEPLLVRSKEVHDGALPSGNARAALALLRLARLTGRTEWEERVEELLKAFAGPAGGHPSAHTALLTVYDRLRAPSREVVLVGIPGAPDTEALRAVLDGGPWPDTEVVYRPAPKDDSAPEVDESDTQVDESDTQVDESDTEVDKSEYQGDKSKYQGDKSAAAPDNSDHRLDKSAADPILELAPFVRPYGLVDGKAAAYVCRDHVCHAPVTTPEELRAQLEAEA